MSKSFSVRQGCRAALPAVLPLFFPALLSCVAFSRAVAQNAIGTPAVSMIPYPASVAATPGVRFVVGPRVSIALSAPGNSELRSLGGVAKSILDEELGITAQLSPVRAHSAATNVVALVLTPKDSATGAESYKLDVSARGVTITAPRPRGIFYGLQTLRQLIQSERARTLVAAPAITARPPAGTARPARRAESVTLAGVRIEDTPRFRYRGLHLDSGRHFQPVEFVKRYIDLMSRYKYNTFHWHLTEDQGWRIEIKRYPRLTEIGGCRKETLLGRMAPPYVGDATPYCGYYTQAQIRDVVAYAKARYVTIIPEIEMPGHAKAAITAYPELACTPGPFDVRTRWGIDEDIFCPSERTFTFLENVLTEVIALFPSTYIHIGGDEAPKARWKASPVAQEVIRREKLKDEEELQSYFVQRIERFLTAHGRRLIGWDEILEGGLAPQATVMSWRGFNGGIAAARANHDVVMAPGSHTYLDHNQGDVRFEPLSIGGSVPLETVYSFEPIPDSLTAEQATHILGAQGQLWTEYMATTDQMEYMAYPRAFALAEVVWSPKSARNWDSFRSRLLPQILALDALGVRNRFPSVDGLERDRTVPGDSTTLELRTAVPEAEIHYTLDGTVPTRQSPLYTKPIALGVTPAGVQVMARAFLGELRVSPLRAATFKRAP